MIDFNILIENYLKKEFKIREIGRYYPSEAGSCFRKIWFSYKKPKEIDVDIIKIFEVGNLLHGFISDVIRSEKNPHIEIVEEETSFEFKKDDIIISGRPDEVVLLKINGKKFLVEVKSTRSLKFLSRPQESHVLQLQIYMYAKNIHSGIILYIEKNTLQSKSFDVEYNEEKAKKAIERLKIVHDYLTENKLPEPEAKSKGEEWMCSYCQYREECEEE